MHISYSELKTWAECPFKRKLIYLDRVRKFVGNEFTAFGRAIHSFCESLIRQFPIEAGVAPHFTVIDDRSVAEIKSEVRMALMVNPKVCNSSIQKSFDHIASLIDESSLIKLVAVLDINPQRIEKMIKSFGSVDGVIKGLRKRLKISDRETKISISSNFSGLDKQSLLRVAEVFNQSTPSNKARALIIKKWIFNKQNFTL